MSGYLPDNVSNRAFDDEPDPLENKPEGFCPWCATELSTTSIEESDDVTLTCDHKFCPCEDWDFWADEDENRARYAKQREADWATEERMTRDARKRGREEL